MKVLITGVHTGLGRELAELYLEDGARVYALGRKAPDGLPGALRFEAADL